MTAEEIVEQLKPLGIDTYKKTMLNHGIQEPFIGVKIEDLKKFQKRIKKDYRLALDLYDTGIYDAMYLAGLIADDPKMTKKDLRRWLAKANCSALQEYTVPWVAAESNHRRELALEWIESNEEGVASAGWATLSSLVAIKDDADLDLAELKQLLQRVQQTIHQQPNRVRYVMNGFVIAVGSYVQALTDLALQTGGEDRPRCGAPGRRVQDPVRPGVHPEGPATRDHRQEAQDDEMLSAGRHFAGASVRGSWRGNAGAAPNQPLYPTGAACMNLEYVPLLRIQRELQGLPRNYRRFQQYLRTMLNQDGVELPPLGIMNPMGKDHVTALLDALLALDADGIGARAAADASAALADVPGEFKIALVVADDLMGGWTNRYDYEFAFRFGPAHRRSSRPGFAVRLSPAPMAQALLAHGRALEQRTPLGAGRAGGDPPAAYRLAYVHRHGPARTLRDMLTQEGQVMAPAGCTGPVLDAEDIAYTREVLTPFLDADDKRTCIECLFGDAAGRTLGFTPRGLSPWAGLALALHDARSNQVLQPNS